MVKFSNTKKNDYFITKRGKVFRVSRKNKIKKELKQKTNNSGYKEINLVTGCFLVHRLVALAFLNKIKNKNCVNHKDGNKSNNNVKNLEFVNHSENEKHAIAIGLKIIHGENNNSSKLKEHQVINIKSMIGKYKLKEIAKMYNVTPTAISLIKRGVNWSYLNK